MGYHKVSGIKNFVHYRNMPHYMCDVFRQAAKARIVLSGETFFTLGGSIRARPCDNQGKKEYNLVHPTD